MKSGPMRDRVEIQTRTVAQDTYGDAIPTWLTVATRWGRLEPLSGRELWQAQQVRPDITLKVTLRYYDGLSPKHRLVIGSRVLNIESVINPDGRKREHQVMCKEEV